MNRNHNSSEAVNVSSLPLHTRATIITEKLISSPDEVFDNSGKRVRKAKKEEHYRENWFKSPKRRIIEQQVERTLDRHPNAIFIARKNYILVNY